MTTKNKIHLLRACFWIGAIVDTIAGIQLLLPNFWAQFTGLTTYTPSTTLNFALAIGSTMMFSWTALLVWADRKPLERKGVVLLTLFPLCGLILNNISAAVSGLRPLQSALPELTLQFTLATLFTFSYLYARKESDK